MSTLPTHMTAIAISAPGGPEVLVAEQRPCPRPQAGEILLKVAAAGVNRPDVMQRQGLYPPPPGAPDIPGLELAGTIVELGAGAARFSANTRKPHPLLSKFRRHVADRQRGECRP